MAVLYCRFMRIFVTWTLPFLLNAFIVVFYLVNGVGELQAAGLTEPDKLLAKS